MARRALNLILRGRTRAGVIISIAINIFSRCAAFCPGRKIVRALTGTNDRAISEKASRRPITQSNYVADISCRIKNGASRETCEAGDDRTGKFERRIYPNYISASFDFGRDAIPANGAPNFMKHRIRPSSSPRVAFPVSTSSRNPSLRGFQSSILLGAEYITP